MGYKANLFNHSSTPSYKCATLPIELLRQCSWTDPTRTGNRRVKVFCINQLYYSPNCTLSEVLTHDPHLRRMLLYTTELSGHLYYRGCSRIRTYGDSWFQTKCLRPLGHYHIKDNFLHDCTFHTLSPLLTYFTICIWLSDSISSISSDLMQITEAFLNLGYCLYHIGTASSGTISTYTDSKHHSI